MAENPIPATQLSASEIDYERRQLAGFREKLQHESNLVRQLTKSLAEIDDQEKAGARDSQGDQPGQSRRCL